jgi:Uma2 family endonuclease
MSLPLFSNVSYEEYLALREKSEECLEYIDGVVYMTPSLSIKHQLVSSNIHTQFGIYLKGKKCKVFAAPTDIELVSDKLPDRKVVIPDLSIICDGKGFIETK